MSPPPVRLNPFPGLRPFETRDKFLYFGREEQTAELLSRLRERRFLAVVGTSGSGKSSLVRAGLIPGLHGGFMAGAGPNWKIAVMRPGGDPVGNLSEALAKLDLRERGPEADAFIRATLARSAFGLAEFAQQAPLPERYNLLVVVDQFEEIFRFRSRSKTLEEDAGGFVRLLLEAAGQRGRPVYVVLTMRSDFLGECAEFSGLAEAINEGEYLIPRMKREQYRLAVEGPVRVGGGRISGRLVQRLLNDMGSNPDQLPVLQHALLRTWDHWVAVRESDEPIDLEHYEAVGTMTEALSRHADEVYRTLTDEGQRVLASVVFKALTESGPDNRGLRRPTRLRALAEIAGVAPGDLVPVINPFRAPGRTFLTPALSGTDSDDEDDDRGVDDRGGVTPIGPESVIDISHESLMRVWTRLQGWVRQEAASAAVYRRLAESARLNAEGTFDLYRDPELQVALNWRKENAPTPAWGERYAEGFDRAMALLEKSAKARDDARRAVVRRRRVLFAAITGVACLFFILWVYAMVQHRRSTSRLLSMRAENLVGVDPRESVLLARAAVRASPLEESVSMLRRAVWHSRLLKDDWELPLSRSIQGAAVSPDGSRALVLVETNAYLYSTRSTRPAAALQAHTARIHASDFSSNGLRVVTASEDGRGMIWDAVTGKRQAELRGHGDSVPMARFSPDGLRVVTASRDGTARVWDVAQGVERSKLTPGDASEQNGEILSAAFNRRGDWVALGQRNGVITVWDWATRRLVWKGRHADTNQVLDVTFSPDDRYLGSSGDDSRARVWSISGESIESRAQVVVDDLRAEQVRVTRLDFSPGTRLLVTGNDQGYSQIWEWASGRPLFVLRHRDEALGPMSVVSTEFTAEGSRVFTAGSSNMARLWETGVRELPATSDWAATRWDQVKWAVMSPGGRELLVGDGSTNAFLVQYPEGGIVATLSGHAGEVKAGLFHPTEPWVITAGADQRLGVWNAQTGRQVRWVVCTNSAESGFAFSGDGRRLAIARGKTVRVHDTATWSEEASLTNHANRVQCVAFSGDGGMLASGGQDNQVYIWRTGTWSLVASNGIQHSGWVSSVAFHPRSGILATASHEIRFLDGGKGFDDSKKIGQSARRKVDHLNIQFASSGECAVSTDEVGNVDLWDVPTHRLLGQVPTRANGELPVVVLSPKGDEILTMGKGGLGLAFRSVAWGSARELVTEVDARWGAARPRR